MFSNRPVLFFGLNASQAMRFYHVSLFAECGVESMAVRWRGCVAITSPQTQFEFELWRSRTLSRQQSGIQERRGFRCMCPCLAINLKEIPCFGRRSYSFVG